MDSETLSLQKAQLNLQVCVYVCVCKAVACVTIRSIGSLSRHLRLLASWQT